MKILLDESLPRKLRNDFSEGHEVFTVRDMGWLGKKNSELLGLMTLKEVKSARKTGKKLQVLKNFLK